MANCSFGPKSHQAPATKKVCIGKELLPICDPCFQEFEAAQERS